MRVAFFQTTPIFGNIKTNVENVIAKIYSIDAHLLVLPELFNTGYQFKSEKEVSRLAEDIPKGYTSRRLIEAAKMKKIFLVAGIAEKYRGKFYNSSILVGPKGFIGIYRKAHLFWNEKRFFSPGNTPFEVYNIGPAKIGMMICFDWLFPEAARILAIKGADIICHPSNLVLPHCPQAMITRCLENRVFAITANRIGIEERIKKQRLRFIGQSEIVAPNGKILYRASGNREEIGIIEIDPKVARDKNITSLNNIFVDRRKKFYKPLI
ncbi:MAG: acyltransferase [Deltaproteobacteria bacterium GWC2_42_51]|nr:MAG: acyltransferase [Deltaproteobacteria bacterium GWA2_42_85]OGP25797.1 MAG: acyltransferase [Deltaproteobacteria bacterium GWB2_42_7]OGP31719.1 MAG: acyltransferase [Deltaproteobacteria bacterium GWC2_42_51]OGP43885.1 MAG: acyltransferase [Deltaproteobacteria bacterium GWD2_42_10]OGP46775.1 MAG: acyltransferase [Deltaproteobacteria bacterium GWF2_42_12]OGQ29993.1 MAG: acyltransferase [Deltaproteobacteria bacterium RIFCSPHIGHO2_02_FULL_42_44]OGQ35203.1 MAG: acyltransferase [Deltaproteoba